MIFPPPQPVCTAVDILSCNQVSQKLLLQSSDYCVAIKCRDRVEPFQTCCWWPQLTCSFGTEHSQSLECRTDSEKVTILVIESPSEVLQCWPCICLGILNRRAASTSEFASWMVTALVLGYDICCSCAYLLEVIICINNDVAITFHHGRFWDEYSASIDGDSQLTLQRRQTVGVMQNGK